MTHSQSQSLYKNADISNSSDIYYFGDIEMSTLMAYKIDHIIHIDFIQPFILNSPNSPITHFMFNKKMDLIDVITKF